MKSSKVFLSRKVKPLRLRHLPGVYKILRKAFGHQRWWPGQTRFEIIIGAILTQNTAWTNVEKALHNLRKERLLNPAALHRTPQVRIAQLIRPSGYFNVKAGRLKAFLDFLFQEYGGSLERMRREKGSVLRDKLLTTKGIGPETADSILLYALDKPFFVVDAYTKRIFTRHQLQSFPASRRLDSRNSLVKRRYEEWQALFVKALPPQVSLYNDYHAQVVRLAKNYCKSSNPICPKCPLAKYL